MIPTRDRRELLLRSLASVRAQTVTDLEIVVVDDGSTDDTTRALAGLEDARIVVIGSSVSHGVSHARNRGIAAATGEWIALLDDDDLWSPEKLARQLAAASESGRGWACSGSVTVDATLRIIAGSPPPSARAIVTTLPLRNCVPAGASNVLVRRDVLMATGNFDIKLRHLADWDLWIRLAAHGLPAVVPVPDVAYRLHGANASDDTDAISYELSLMAGRYGARRGSGALDRAFVFRWAAWHQLRAGRRIAAVRSYARAVAAGDAVSGVRAVAALVDRHAVSRKLDRVHDSEWSSPAARWLAGLS